MRDDKTKLDFFPQGLVQNFLAVFQVISVLLLTTNSLFCEPKDEAYYRTKKFNREPRGEKCHDFPVSVNHDFYFRPLFNQTLCLMTLVNPSPRKQRLNKDNLPVQCNEVFIIIYGTVCFYF